MPLFKVAEEETLANENLGFVHCSLQKRRPSAHTCVVGTEDFVFRTASAIGWLSHPNPSHRWDCPPLQASTSRAAGGTGGLPQKGAFAVVVFSAWVRRSLNT